MPLPRILLNPEVLWEYPDHNLDNNENGHERRLVNEENEENEDGMQLVPMDADDGYFGDGSDDEEPTNGQVCALIEMVHNEAINATYNAADQLAQGINQGFRHQANVM